jgi:hypothetical protein
MINKSKRFIPCMLTLETRDEYLALKDTILETMSLSTVPQVKYKLLAGILEALKQYEAACRTK